MSKKALKFVNVEVNKENIHASKHPVALNLVNINQMLISLDRYVLSYLK